MAKFASKDERGFNPIQDKVLSGLLLEALEKQQTDQISNEPREEAEPFYLTSVAADEPPRFSSAQVLRPQAARSGSQASYGSQRKKPAEKLSRTVKCLLSPSEDHMVRSLVVRLSDEAGITLTLSFLMRACLDLLLHSEDQLKDEFARSRLERPYNEKTAITDFERQIAEIVHAAIRKAAPLRYR